MGFRINTNIAAMDAHRNAVMTNQGLNKSLNSLSSGLRINKAADDASGMTIADSLRSQAQGLGQAINNANDGVAVVQTADGALDEYIKIINSVRTKSIQAASDGQNAGSRKAIQSDITRLLEAANSIANTTQFNGQKLLDGTFTNKAFHIGAYAGETVSFSVGNVQTNTVGDVASVNNDGTVNSGTANDGIGTHDALTAGNLQSGTAGQVLKAGEFKLNGIDVSSAINTQNPVRLTDSKEVAAAITKATGLLANATTKVQGAAIGGGAIDATDFLEINGFKIADVTVVAGDTDGVLAKAINDISDQTGVTATVANGKLTLNAVDGRNIAVTTTTNGATRTGLSDTSTSIAGSSQAALSTTATSALTLTTGQVIINGHDMVGVYGSTTAGTAATAFLNAVKDIAGLEDSSITSGALTLKATNGDDVNVSGSSVATIGAVAGVTNSSDVGVINVYGANKLTVAGTDPGSFGFAAGTSTAKSNGTSLESIDVTNRNSAEVGILIADSALKSLDATRSDLGSVQNQLESTIRNISVTQVNVTSAESQIRDVDFAQESANFAKLNILAQSGSYAMSQANAIQQNVMRLLQ